jgi:sulfide:quinone oxidoreductase
MTGPARAHTVTAMSAPSSSRPADVVILGGGVAGLEAMMALREHAGARVRIALVAAQQEFVERPMTVAEPFDRGSARRIPLERIAADFGATFTHAEAIGVNADATRVVFAGGESMGGDTVIVAVGARPVAAFPDAVTFGLPGSGEAMRALLAELETGAVRRVAFVAPSLAGWALPLYELALMTARAVAARGSADVRLSLVTPEGRPLAIFGGEASETAARLLASAGIEFIGDTHADVRPGAVFLRRDGRSLAVDRVVALPLLCGPRLQGVPSTPSGFVRIDGHGRVPGRSGLYAAGDAADFPVKQGGIAAAQADAVAQHVAARHGALDEPAPFRPVLRGMLLTGDAPQFVRSVSRDSDTVAAWHPLWWPPTKIAGPHLSAYLFGRDLPEPIRPHACFIDVDVPLTAATLPG